MKRANKYYHQFSIDSFQMQIGDRQMARFTTALVPANILQITSNCFNRQIEFKLNL